MKVLRNTRKFGRKSYTYWGSARTRQAAQVAAKQARSRGFLARVRRTTKYPGDAQSPYVIYASHKG